MSSLRAAAAVLLAFTLASCGSTPDAPADAGDNPQEDAGRTERDGGRRDADGEEADAGDSDVGEPDAGPTSVCGDGAVEGGEACDGGNVEAFDGCDENCVIEPCGNGTVDDFEQCDDGNNDNGDGCNFLCRREAVCGDRWLHWAEACDDGNVVAGDGCDASCNREPRCGDGVGDAGETCDDGNTAAGDGCSATCAQEALGTCGNGVLEWHEPCDDGNLAWEDGCTPKCTFEGNDCVTCRDRAFGGDESPPGGVRWCPGSRVREAAFLAAMCDPGSACASRCEDGCAAGSAAAASADCTNCVLQLEATVYDVCVNDRLVRNCGDGIVMSEYEECDGGPDCDAGCHLSCTTCAGRRGSLSVCRAVRPYYEALVDCWCEGECGEECANELVCGGPYASQACIDCQATQCVAETAACSAH